MNIYGAKLIILEELNIGCNRIHGTAKCRQAIENGKCCVLNESGVSKRSSLTDCQNTIKKSQEEKQND